MNLAIFIPEQLYANIIEDNCSMADMRILLTIIKHGTPLPKGHGRLIDADALKKDDEVTIWKTRDSSRTGKTLKFFSELFIKKIEDAPTIIEAEEGD